ncbi:MAG: AAA family ATPase, partial [Vulcanimicrobiaceae bacterium]
MPDFTSVDTRVPFVGRIEELGRLFALFEYGGALTLVGPGGVGKSRLAYEAAVRFERDRAREVIFVPLSGVGPEAVFGSVIAAIGGREHAGRGPLEVIYRELAPRHAILVLDNCEHVPDEAGALIESLQRVHNMAVVATSQRRLDYPDERVLDVAPFDAITGTMFFQERARAANIHIADKDVPITTRIVERLDGL